MGWGQSKRIVPDPDEDVNFDHFEILRAIGKGSFGKVCIVQKRGGTSNMYAMKYVHKDECAERGALRNIVREVEILSELEHPNLVNLWFSFQDEEDLFMVSDLLLGGDLRYHIQQQVQFTERNIVLYVAEIALALDYLQDHKILHRDIKPDNILLDEDGHARVTDFNIATILQDGRLATSMSGTKPYMAPEIYMCSCDENGVLGYGYPVDWWSLGILAWETMAGTRPYPLHSSTSHREAIEILKADRETPSDWTPAIKELLDRLLTLEPGRRISTLQELKQVEVMSKLDFDKVLRKEVKPDFAPPKDHLNCDPTFELEEMIIETKPLHKKKKRLAKQRSLKVDSTLEDTVAGEGAASDPRRLVFIPEYRVYNRERELEKRESDRKEDEWQEELDTAMENAGERMSKGKGNDGKKKGNKQQKLSPTPSTSTAATASMSTSCCLLTVPSKANVKARINASPRLGAIRKHATTSSSSDIDYIDATPGPSTSKL